jgi:hypothetical protein
MLMVGTAASLPFASTQLLKTLPPVLTTKKPPEGGFFNLK